MTRTLATLGKQARQLNPVVTVAYAQLFQYLCPLFVFSEVWGKRPAHLGHSGLLYHRGDLRGASKMNKLSENEFWNSDQRCSKKHLGNTLRDWSGKLECAARAKLAGSEQMFRKAGFEQMCAASATGLYFVAPATI